VLDVAAVGLFVGVVAHLPHVDTPVDIPWTLWVAAFALGEVLVVHVQVRRDSHTFSMTDLVLVAALCLAPASAVVTAQLVGTGIVLLLDRRQSRVKFAFNLAEFAFVDCLATMVFTTVTRGAPWSSVWTWAGALGAVAVTTVTANLLVFAAITLADGEATARALRRLILMSLPFALGTGTVGLLVVRAAVLDPMSLLLMVAPAVLMIAAYRAYTRARRQEDNLRLLHEVTSLLYDGEDAREGLGKFVTAVRQAFRAGVAELILVGDAGNATVTGSRDGHEAAALVPIEENEDAAGLLRAAIAADLTTTRTGLPAAAVLDAYVEQRGLRNAVLSVLRTGESVQGLLLVGSRLGEVTTFTDSDLTMLATFARHVATSLERGRLQSDLRHVTDLQEKLRHQAMHDALTGLPNRTLFLDRAENALRLAGRTGVWPGVFYLDLDGFKPVNDTYGHEAGDVLLQAFAERLRGCLRSADTAARLGGDEFAVLVNGPIDADGVARVVNRIRAEMARPIDLGGGRRATVGASIGVAIGDRVVAEVEALLRRADIAMYRAKRARDGRHVLYDEALGDRVDPQLNSAIDVPDDAHREPAMDPPAAVADV
jgi:diguanylate cyclase (GGDEF)-like protein